MKYLIPTIKTCICLVVFGLVLTSTILSIIARFSESKLNFDKLNNFGEHYNKCQLTDNKYVNFDIFDCDKKFEYGNDITDCSKYCDNGIYDEYISFDRLQNDLSFRCIKINLVKDNQTTSAYFFECFDKFKSDDIFDVIMVSNVGKVFFTIGYAIIMIIFTSLIFYRVKIASFEMCGGEEEERINFSKMNLDLSIIIFAMIISLMGVLDTVLFK